MSIAPLKVLIVEDQHLIELIMCEMVRHLGCAVAGSSIPAEALQLAETEDLDFALLDYDLGNGRNSIPIAEALRRRAIPFAFVTGKDSDAIETRYPDVPVLDKPLQLHQLEGLLPSRSIN